MANKASYVYLLLKLSVWDVRNELFLYGSEPLVAQRRLIGKPIQLLGNNLVDIRRRAFLLTRIWWHWIYGRIKGSPRSKNTPAGSQFLCWSLGYHLFPLNIFILHRSITKHPRKPSHNGSNILNLCSRCHRRFGGLCRCRSCSQKVHYTIVILTWSILMYLVF